MLNNKPDINQNTKEVILKAALELDYKPNFLAQSLHKGSTHTIGVIVPDVEHHFFATVLAGTLTGAPVIGLRAILAGRFFFSQIPNPAIETLSPDATALVIVSKNTSTKSRA